MERYVKKNIWNQENMNIYNIKKVENSYYEEFCDFCPNTMFENEHYYLIYTNKSKAIKKCCKQCIKEIYKEIYEEK